MYKKCLINKYMIIYTIIDHYILLIKLYVHNYKKL